MADSERSREESVMDWKETNGLRVAPGLANITNKPADLQPQASSKTTAAETRPFGLDDKENPAPMGKPILYEPSATPLSLRKAVLPSSTREHMAQQFDALQGKLHAIKRDGHRASISGVPPGLTGVCASIPSSADDLPGVGGHPAPIGALAARLESLKRDNSRLSFMGSAAQTPQFEIAAQYDVSGLSKAALQLFGDKEFVAMCERGMNAQLTRSKDGATEETKIKELAGMVKTLRRAMKELQQRTQLFIDQSVRFEKEASQQVESVKLASESAAMAAQAELANARREAASASANHKTALANWQGELDLHKAEAASLKREIERIEGERDRAREEARKFDAAKGAVEAEMKELKKVQAQRERDLQMDKNSAAQALYETREAAERQKAALEAALAEMTGRADASDAACAALTEELSAATATISRLEKDMSEITAQRDGLAAEKMALTVEVEGLMKRMTIHLAEHEKVVGDSTVTAKALESWQQKSADLLAELEKERGGARATGKQLSALEATLAEVTAEKAVLAYDKQQLESSLTEARKGREVAENTASSAEERAKTAESQLEVLMLERDNLLEENKVQRSDLDQARAAASTAEILLARVSAEAEEKAAKLARLEGELEALQECTMGLEGGDQRELLSRMVSKIAALETAVAAAEARRREAHERLVELKGNVRVFCRIRPHPRAVVTAAPDGSSIRVVAENKEHAFAFDRAFGPKTTQAAVFDEVADVVQSALDGYKVCLFSYGQTGAGKTHTMQGGQGVGDEGIIPRSIAKILATVARLQDQGWEYSLEASYIEVYNEQLRDLLGGNSQRLITESNAIQHGADGGHTVVLGATRVAVDSEETAAALVRKAAAARAVESTAMNAVSSRSHSVFMLYITGRHEASGTLLRGSLNLVDLAGSERLGRSQAEGQRQKEACSINKSLSALGDVFAALASKAAHVPYRNSKLTHLLQPCLGGSGKTLMFVNINPEPESVGESLCSLRFAAKVNACETAAKGGATRNATSVIGGAADAMSGVFRPSTSVTFDSRTSMPAVTGRASIAPNGGGASRRMSMIPGAAGVKRSAPAPQGPTRLTRPKFN